MLLCLREFYLASDSYSVIYQRDHLSAVIYFCCCLDPCLVSYYYSHVRSTTCLSMFSSPSFWKESVFIGLPVVYATLSLVRVGSSIFMLPDFDMLRFEMFVSLNGEIVRNEVAEWPVIYCWLK